MKKNLPNEKGFVLFCDECFNYEKFECGIDWDWLIKNAKELGWRFKFKGDRWMHFCPVCVEDWQSRKIRAEVWKKHNLPKEKLDGE